MNNESALLKKRHRAERRFQWYGRLSILFALAVLVFLLGSLIAQGASGFFQTQIRLDVPLPAIGDKDISYNAMVYKSFQQHFPQVTGAEDKKALAKLLSPSAGLAARKFALQHPEQAGRIVVLWLPAATAVDLYAKGKVDKNLPEAQRPISDQQIEWVKTLKDKEILRTAIHTGFFERGDSREPELAGFMGSVVGSLLTMLICMALAFPLGVLTAIYLEEFAPKNRFVDFIEVNINNLAAVPSIVFGLLGLAVFLNTIGLERSSPVVGGLTLAMMILPVIIITTRLALKAVPGTIRDAAMALGASPLQVVVHHVLPLAVPGIMTGMILGIARAIGETAPLLMIGMVAFIVDIPTSFTDSATVMPVQIYLWASSPEMGFVEKTAAGILVLLAILTVMNSLAIYVRKRYEQRW